MTPDPTPRPEPKWDAATYHIVSSVQASWGVELAAQFDWRGDEVVLDAGCGSGRLSLALLDHVPRGRLIAVDADANMAAQAAQTLADPITHGRAEVHEAGLLDFVAPEPVDVVFSNAVFHWISDHERLWRKCREWLKPEGRLWAQCGGAGNIGPQLELARTLASEPPYAEVLGDIDREHNFSTAEKAKAGLEAAGFADVQSWLEVKDTPFDSEASFAPFIRTVILRHYQGPLGPDLWEEFLGEWIKRHLELHGPNLHYVRLNLQARRPN